MVRGHLGTRLLWLVLLTALLSPATAHAFFETPANTCVKLLTDSSAVQNGTDASPTPLADSPVGRSAYKKLQELVHKNSDIFLLAREAAVRRGDTLGKFLQFIRNDRIRLITGLESIAASLSDGSDEQQTILHTLTLVRQDEHPDESEERMRERLLERCAPDCASPLRAADDNRRHEDYENFVQQYHAKSYSFISELLTAFEIKGFTGIGFHAHQIFDPLSKPKLLDALKRRGSERLANLEIDAASFDPSNGTVTWFEVKHVGRRVDVYSKRWIDTIRTRIETFRDFNAIVQSDRKLQKLWPYKMEMRFVFRGAGVTQEMITLLKERYGIIVYDGNVDEYNLEYGQKRTYAKAQ